MLSKHTTKYVNTKYNKNENVFVRVGKKCGKTAKLYLEDKEILLRSHLSGEIRIARIAVVF